MADPRVRRQIALRAAQMMYAREEKEYFTAKRKAARQFGLDPKSRPRDLPSNREIRDHIQVLADLFEGDSRRERLTGMRLNALRTMRVLEAFRPHLIGSVLTGHIRKGSDIDLHLFSDSISAITSTLEDHGLEHTVEHKRIIKHGEERMFTHVHVAGACEVELTVYPLAKVNYPFRSSITGTTIERANIAALEALLVRENPDIDLGQEEDSLEDHVDPYELFRMLLIPLESVKQNPKFHPEGDALYHSLQVFELAAAARPWDEEFLQAALLHDVGKAIDPSDHAAAGLAALEGAISERTAFLIEFHMEAHAYREGTLGARARHRLEASENYEDVLLLSELDRLGRKRGAAVRSVEEALAFIKTAGSYEA